MESLKSKIQTAEEALQCLKQGLGTFDRATILECIQTLEDIGAPKSTNEEDGRSISRNQQIGAKRSATIDIENYKEVQFRVGGD